MCSAGDGEVLQSGSHLKHFALWEGEGRDIQLVSHARSGVTCMRVEVLLAWPGLCIKGSKTPSRHSAVSASEKPDTSRTSSKPYKSWLSGYAVMTARGQGEPALES